MEIGGLVTKEDYGYDGEGETCKFNRSRVAARVTGGAEISQNETQMAQWLLQNGPISVGLNAIVMLRRRQSPLQVHVRPERRGPRRADCWLQGA